MKTKQTKLCNDLIQLDGSLGEGGGQILRTALSLSMVTGRPFRLTRIRGKRKKPGLLRQHLAAVRAATQLCGAEVEGDRPGSQVLSFTPGAIRAGDYTIPIGTAGSTLLVLQTVLPAMLMANGPCTILVEGGTHNPFSPPFEFFAQSFLPLLRKMGAEVTAHCERPGFYPAGGGRVSMQVAPVGTLTPLKLMSRGSVSKRKAVCVLSQIPDAVAEKELKEVQRRLEFREQDLLLNRVENAACPGNALQVILESKSVTEVFTAFGQLGVPSKRVAQQVCNEAKGYLAVDVPVGRHLADQLLIPMAMAGSGRFRTQRLSGHTLTNINVIEAFYPLTFEVTQKGDGIIDVMLKVKGEEV